MTTTLANQLPRINLANLRPLQGAQVGPLKSGHQNASSVHSKSPMHSLEPRTSSTLLRFAPESRATRKLRYPAEPPAHGSELKTIVGENSPSHQSSRIGNNKHPSTTVGTIKITLATWPHVRRIALLTGIFADLSCLIFNLKWWRRLNPSAHGPNGGVPMISGQVAPDSHQQFRRVPSAGA